MLIEGSINAKPGVKIKNANKNNPLQGGFSIVELAIVLTIIALIGASALSVGASRIESARIRITESKIEYLMEVFELYVKNKGYFPCPADPILTIDDADFGLGDGTGTVGPGNCAASNLTDDTSTNVMMGMIPAQELALSSTDTVDGWNRRFSYAVDEDLTFSDGSDPLNLLGWANPDEDGEIEIRNENIAIVSSNAAMVLISHGSNGHGAWKAKGGSRINIGCGVDSLEDANTSLTACASVDSRFIKRFRSSTYDDMLDYRIKWQMDIPE